MKLLDSPPDEIACSFCIPQEAARLATTEPEITYHCDKCGFDFGYRSMEMLNGHTERQPLKGRRGKQGAIR